MNIYYTFIIIEQFETTNYNTKLKNKYVFFFLKDNKLLGKNVLLIKTYILLVILKFEYD